jgi:hypothetical protein
MAAALLSPGCFALWGDSIAVSEVAPTTGSITFNILPEDIIGDVSAASSSISATTSSQVMLSEYSGSATVFIKNQGSSSQSYSPVIAIGVSGSAGQGGGATSLSMLGTGVTDWTSSNGSYSKVGAYAPVTFVLEPGQSWSEVGSVSGSAFGE